MNISPEDNFYDILMRSYIKLYMPGLFVVEDRISMAHGLEARTPLCDNTLLDLALKIPLKTKLNRGILKAIPKANMRGILPDILWQLPKRGFPTPLSMWLRTTHKNYLKEKLGSSSPLNTVFIPEKLAALVDNYISTPLKHLRPLDEIPTHRMWLLLVLDSCMRRRNLLWK